MKPNSSMPDPENYWKLYLAYLAQMLPWEQKTVITPVYPKGKQP